MFTLRTNNAVYSVKATGLIHLQGGWWRDLGGMSVGFRSNKHKEWAMWKGKKKEKKKKKKTPQIIGIMCSMGFKHTHIQTD